MFADSFRDKTVWLSGDTGFKGAWLAHWLLSLGAKVRGFALPPPTKPALFDQLGLAKRISHEAGDIRDAELVKKSILSAQPDFVFHLAAQPLVRHSYQEPLATYSTNVMGTAHVLEALRSVAKPCAAVIVTTDKCYENREWLYGYRENDPLGGRDPYSSSKAAAEIVTGAYIASFFSGHKSAMPAARIASVNENVPRLELVEVKIATARAGNVIGGGDWALDRIVPDCMRALQNGQAIPVRNRTATRPWQHVLEPLSGYLWLAAVLADPKLTRFDYPKQAPTFNFGPGHESNRTVAELVTEVLKHWAGKWEDRSDPKAVHEAGLLQLATDKANALLDWSPVWKFPETVARTTQWYRRVAEPGGEKMAAELSSSQIEEYSQQARKLEISWAVK